jgi:hypothetical protein
VCAEIYLASIGVAVHRDGNPVQKFFSACKIILSFNRENIFSRAAAALQRPPSEAGAFAPK